MKLYLRPQTLLTAALLLGLILAGCSRRPSAVKEREKAAADTVRTPQDESFDPFSIEDEEGMRMPDSRLKTSGGTASERTSRKAAKSREVAGFRVQLVATDSEGEARSVEQQALLDFPDGVYLIFDPPNYKVRVGDCESRPRAMELRDKAVKLGYPNAWVVQSRVTVADR
ncbi:MAG: SPOR domain-containing protein [Candidatus Zixiibacteriota bacterium]|nr:MAG: SPOR domain-containing protein [candidate division Zixibacteria bacterium]